MIQKFRKLHTYLGVFFTPLLLFFVASGWYQTVSPDRKKEVGEAEGWKDKLVSVHVDQIYPQDNPEIAYSPKLFVILVVVMCIALILTTGLGVYLAFRLNKTKWPVYLALALGILVPVVLLVLGQKKL